ncbi:MAG TPA: alpha-(1-_3)-arabinofuranosyltransferase [Streptosporangiaceae bacterium]|nr:alpha-(1->3)-arabinofuranosyltransferase [Streptosporangiaceae bacterium]
MTTAGPAIGGVTGAIDTRLRHRMRLSVSCLVLVTATFSIAPGKIVSDTKLDMPINPAGFLARALHLWDANEQFGQLQNQAYGYLFPMGPFYLLGRALGFAPWVTQRLWMSLVLCAAFLGVVKLAGALGIGTENGRMLAGFAYAVAPRTQELIAINSSEFLPTAVLPWILLPLVKGAREGSPRRAAALSALAIVCCGGINGAAELAVLVVPLLYLLTRAKGRRKWRLLGWWLGCTAVACFWWTLPLLLMGRYVFSFIDYVESASTTTQTTSLTNIFRGASDWVGYIPVDGLPWLPAGFSLSTAPWLIVLTGVVAALGVIGLCRRGLPERTFLLATLLIGVAIIVMGHQSAIAPPFADGLRGWFDTWLAPFRNIHKFDALVRLPIALGLGFLLAGPLPKWRPALTLVTLGALAGTFVPVLSVGLAARGSYDDLPAYWRQASDWLNRNAGENTVLAVPGQRFGEYLWGRTIDDPLQPLMRARWASRMIVPTGSAGLARLMEAIDDRFASGYGSPGLSTVLSRMGVRFLLVRNDIQRDAGRGTGTWPARVHEALFRTPGVHKVAEFGGFWGRQFNVDATVSYDQPYKALEIYEVSQAEPLVNAVPTRRPLRVTGGPEALLTLADAGLLDGDRPVLFNGDGGAADIPGSDTVVTDTLRRREVNFADVRKGSSPTLTETDRYKGSSRVKDLIEPDWRQYETVARLIGIRSVTASSSASDITSLPQLRSAGQQPYAAIDGDAHTTWTSAGWFGAVGEWLEVRFRGPTRLSQLNLAFAVNELLGPPVSEVSIETAAGKIKQPVKATGAVQTLSTPNGTTDHVRIKITKLAYQPQRKFGSRVGISELSIPGMWPARAIVAPKVESPGGPAGAGAQTIALTGLTGSSPPCMLGSRSWVCNPLLEVQGEDGDTFDRVFTASASGEYRITGTALLTSLKTIEQYTTLRPPTVSASSASVEHPADMGRSAFDGDRATTWISNPLDRQPTLSVDFGRRVTLSRLKFIFPNEITQRPMTQVGVAGAKALRQGWLDQTGTFTFAPITTDKLIIKFLVGGSPVQITDIEVPGVKPLGPPPGLPLRTVCGAGPTFLVAGTGQRVLTRLVGGTVADLAQGHPVPYESCGKLPLFAGEQRLYVGAGDPFQIAGAVVRPVDALRAPAVQDQPMEVNTWTPQRRSVSVSTTSESFLVVNDNYNEGWRAEIGGERLRSVRLDGWRQAWVLPKNTEGTVEMVYGPDRWYRGGLLLGFLLIVSLVLLAAVPARRDELVRAPALRPGRIAPRWAWVLAPVLGLWAGGFYGLAGTTATVGLLVALRRHEGRSPLAARLAAAVRSPYAAGGLLTVAAAASALGTLLATQERYGIADGFRDVLPQLLCLPLIGYLVWTLCRPAPALAALPAVSGAARRPGPAVRSGEIPSAWGPPPGEPPPSAWGPVPGPPPLQRDPVREPVGSAD